MNAPVAITRQLRKVPDVKTILQLVFGLPLAQVLIGQLGRADIFLRPEIGGLPAAHWLALAALLAESALAAGDRVTVRLPVNAQR